MDQQDGTPPGKRREGRPCPGRPSQDRAHPTRRQRLQRRLDDIRAQDAADRAARQEAEKAAHAAYRAKLDPIERERLAVIRDRQRILNAGAGPAYDFCILQARWFRVRQEHPGCYSAERQALEERAEWWERKAKTYTPLRVVK